MYLLLCLGVVLHFLLPGLDGLLFEQLCLVVVLHFLLKGLDGLLFEQLCLVVVLAIVYSCLVVEFVCVSLPETRGVKTLIA